jgi:bifunctional NMN adenylyltransferase/nudix hydrolase
MISQQFPGIVIMPIKDNKSDEIWSNNLDSMIFNICGEKEAILYCGRDGFNSHYKKGRYEVKQLNLKLPKSISGSKIRKDIKDIIIPNKDFRKGVIYATENKRNTAYMACDIAIFKDYGTRILLGQKKEDGDKWRLPGGFFDINQDSCLEESAYRELREECGPIDIGGWETGLEYVGNSIVDDWRYRDSKDKIMSILFKGIYSFGTIKAGDDLSNCDWIEFRKVKKYIIPTHMENIKMLEYIKGEK